ncbi:hypothetical protein [Spirosoma foliorum]|uniref:Uncharacterized protein n=1 Tax=Spirosoma foliorum TaxID=2710596 RepID=A0A7G5GZG8_9BACT|nr:hypothetical protein [Spirosoma foliorum]QMW04260.1 hypothetical protein H3H32_04725 [Spirosoma foliorum]
MIIREEVLSNAMARTSSFVLTILRPLADLLVTYSGQRPGIISTNEDVRAIVERSIHIVKLQKANRALHHIQKECDTGRGFSFLVIEEV